MAGLFHMLAVTYPWPAPRFIEPAGGLNMMKSEFLAVSQVV